LLARKAELEARMKASHHDEFLAMRLIRDRVPGFGDRYIGYPMDRLVEALEQYSPIRQAGQLKGNIVGANDEKISTAVKPSPVLEAGESKENIAVETVKESGGDGGESNSPFQAYNLPGLIVRLLDQLSTLGETAGQIKKAMKS